MYVVWADHLQCARQVSCCNCRTVIPFHGYRKYCPVWQRPRVARFLQQRTCPPPLPPEGRAVWDLWWTEHHWGFPPNRVLRIFSFHLFYQCFLFIYLWSLQWVLRTLCAYLINGTFFLKNLFNIECILIFSNTIVWNISHSKRNSSTQHREST